MGDFGGSSTWEVLVVVRLRVWEKRDGRKREEVVVTETGAVVAGRETDVTVMIERANLNGIAIEPVPADC